jgi:type IV pilus assembly protein PilV
MLNVNSAIHDPGSRGEAGSVLLEALIAIVIFSMGILAIVGMQTTAVKAAADAKFRSNASLLATELIGKMWVTDRTGATMQALYQGGGGVNGAAYTAWLAEVIATMPGVSAAVNQPVVVIDPATGMVTVTISWKVPSEPAAHSYAVVAQVK